MSMSLKEQLQSVASQMSDKKTRPNKPVSPPIRNANKPKPKWLDYAQYGVELLMVYFPSCFKSPKEVKPLKKGIKQDLIKCLSSMDSIVIEDKACMVKSLAYYANTMTYHKSMVEGACRVDLEGNEAGVVSDEEAKYSALRYQNKVLAKQGDKTLLTQTEHRQTDG